VDKRAVVRLTEAERAVLTDLLAGGAAPARTQTHARILLKTDQGPAGPGWTDARIATALEVGERTVARVRARWADHGLEDALQRRPPRREYRRKLDGAAEAHLIALACAALPPGKQRWSVRVLAAKLVEAEVVESVGRETVRTTLKKTCSSRG
jgi:homeodomain-containing protein